ncbi:expressed unknown protein [Seminavis robusta]|uniref:Uncharacterized protein n=1 Tax=Seminavis robusta TaxID=568900 RepID=A0A9N8H8U4_9STRA|nr:expressed unknown protein [Seminavis robusta]|eukprot:Sro181_g079190.1 n/a (235) ;mRNA; r:82320-83024
MMMFRLSLLLPLLAATASGFVVPRATVRSSSSLLRAGEDAAVDLGDVISNAKEALADVTEGITTRWEPEIVEVEPDTSGVMDIFSSLSPDVGIAIAGVVVLLGIAAVVSGSSSGETASSGSAPRAPRRKAGKQADVSIPYDAAARLAYDAWVESQEDVKASEEAFVAFKTMYEETAVAAVTAKQKARNLASFDPTKPKPQPRPEPTPKPPTAKAPKPAPAKKAESSTPFFAQVK